MLVSLRGIRMEGFLITAPSNKVAQMAGLEGSMVGITSGSTPEGEDDVPNTG